MDTPMSELKQFKDESPKIDIKSKSFPRTSFRNTPSTVGIIFTVGMDFFSYISGDME